MEIDQTSDKKAEKDRLTQDTDRTPEEQEGLAQLSERILFRSSSPSQELWGAFSQTAQKESMIDELPLQQPIEYGSNNLSNPIPSQTKESFTSTFKSVIDEQRQDKSVQSLLDISKFDNEELRLLNYGIKKVYKNFSNVKFPHKICLMIEERSEDFSEVQYSVFVGQYNIPIILRFIGKNAEPVTRKQCIGYGSFGDVYRQQIGQKMYAIKRMNIKRNYDPKKYKPIYKFIEKIVQEYAVMKLFSFFRIGPKVDEKPTQDIICFDDCVEIRMELCQTLNEKLAEDPSEMKSIYQKFRTEIEEKIRLMHSLHIVHMDIKPDNCLFCPFFGEFVLADFGLTHPVKQNRGEKSWTYLCGTQLFMSQAMKDLQKTQRLQGRVDLYENDEVAFKITLQKIEELKPKRIVDFIFVQNFDYLLAFESEVKRNHKINGDNELEEVLKRLDFEKVIDDVVKILKKLNNFDRLKTIICLIKKHKKLSKPQRAKINDLLNWGLFLEQRQKQRNLKPAINNNILKFRLRTQGATKELRQMYTAQLQKLKQTMSNDEIKRLEDQLQCEVDNLSCSQTMEEIRELCMLRSNYTQAERKMARLYEVKSFASKFQNIIQIAIESILLQRYRKTNKTFSKSESIREVRKQLLDKNNKPPCSQTYLYQFSDCLIKIWEKDIDSKQRAEEFINNHLKNQKLPKAIRYFYVAFKDADDITSCRRMRLLQKQILEKQGRLRTLEGAYMYQQLAITTENFDPNCRQYIKQSETILREILGQDSEDHPLVPLLYHLQGYFEMVDGKYEQAIKTFDKSIELFAKYYAINTDRCSQVINNKGNIYMKKGEYRKSIAHRYVALELRRKALSEKASQYFRNLGGIAQTFKVYGDFQQVLKICDDGIKGISSTSIQPDQNYSFFLVPKFQITVKLMMVEEAKIFLIELEKVYAEILQKKKKVFPQHTRYLAILLAYEGKIKEAIQKIQLNKQQKNDNQKMNAVVLLQILAQSNCFDKKYEQTLLYLKTFLVSDHYFELCLFNFEHLLKLYGQKQTLSIEDTKIKYDRILKPKMIHPMAAIAHSIMSKMMIKQHEKSQQYLKKSKDILRQHPRKIWTGLIAQKINSQVENILRTKEGQNN